MMIPMTMMTKKAHTLMKTKTAAFITALAFSATALAGCSTMDVALPEESTVTITTPGESDSATSITMPSSVQLPNGSNALGVVTAGVLLASGDITKAIETGQVTPSEVKYARLAIQEGTMDLWREIAEADAK